jgi:hypothetical protein
VKTRELCAATISAALAASLLAVGYYLTFGEFFWYFAASVAVAAPPGRGSAAGSALAWIVASLISALLVGGNYLYLLAFWALFGPYPALHALLRGARPWARLLGEGALAFFGLAALFQLTRLFGFSLGDLPAGLRVAALAALAAVSPGISRIYGRAFDAVRMRVGARE